MAAVTNGIVGLFAEYYGRGPERAKSYLLDDRYVVCVLRDTMTTVERTLAPNDPDMVRRGAAHVSRRRWRTRSSAWSRRPRAGASSPTTAS